MRNKDNSINKKNNKLRGRSEGSITIEASLLFPILFIVIIMIVFLMLFYYNKITVWKNTYYTGIKLAETKREGTIYDLQTEWNKICKDTLVLPENAQVRMKKVADRITVTGKIEFTIPFWGNVDIQEKSVVPLYGIRENAARNKLWKE